MGCVTRVRKQWIVGVVVILMMTVVDAQGAQEQELTQGKTPSVAPARAVSSSLPAAAATVGISTAKSSDVPQTLATIKVQASARSRPRIPAVAVRVTHEELARQNVVDTADTLRYVPNLHVRERYVGDVNAPVAGRNSNNLQSAHTLVYMDGLLLSNFMGNGYDFAPRWGMASPQEIASVDVLYGPYSALYPGNSIGNTLLIHTHLPDRLVSGADIQFFDQDYKDDYGGGSYFPGHRFAGFLGDRFGSWRWLLSVSRLDSHSQPLQYATARAGGDPAGAVAVTGATRDRNPDGTPRLIYGARDMEHTRQTQASLQVGTWIGDDTEARFTLGVWHNDARRSNYSFLRGPDGQVVDSGPVLVDGQVWSLSSSALAPRTSDQTHLLYGVQLDGSFFGNWQWEAVVSGYDFLDDLEHDAATAHGAAGTLADMSGSGWQTFDFRSSGPLGRDNTLSAGVHLDRYQLDTRVHDTADWRDDTVGAPVSAFKGQTLTRALYLQDAWTFLPAWTLTLGLRWEWWLAYDGALGNGTDTLAYPARQRNDFSPKASLAWRFAKPWKLRLSYGKAVRYPTVSELFQGTISGNAIVNNNPNLAPERDESFDLSLIRTLARGQWRLSLFQDRFADMLYSQTDVTVTPTVTNVQNVSAVRMRGIEGALTLRDVLPGVDVEASVAWNDAQTRRDVQFPAADGKRFPRMPRLRASLFADWRFAPRWDASLGLRHSGRQYSTLDNSDFVDTYGAVSRFTVADARLRWHFARQWTAAIGVDNLTNEHYWVYHPYPGRTWLLELHWNLRGSES